MSTLKSIFRWSILCECSRVWAQLREIIFSVLEAMSSSFASSSFQNISSTEHAPSRATKIRTWIILFHSNRLSMYDERLRGSLYMTKELQTARKNVRVGVLHVFLEFNLASKPPVCFGTRQNWHLWRHHAGRSGTVRRGFRKRYHGRPSLSHLKARACTKKRKNF